MNSTDEQTPFLVLKGEGINPYHVEAIMLTAISEVVVISLFVWKKPWGTSRKDIFFEIGNEWSYCGNYQLSRFCQAHHIIKRGKIGSWYKDYKTTPHLFEIRSHNDPFHSNQESDRTEMTVWEKFKENFPGVGKVVEYITDVGG